MRMNKKVFWLVASLWICGEAGWVSGASWMRLHGPEGGNIWAIAVKPDDSQTLLVGSSGLYRSTNGGSSWDIIERVEGLGCMDIVFDFHNPNIVYAPCDSELYRSTDAGVNWQGLGIHTGGGWLYAVAVSGDTIYAGGEYNNGMATVPAVYISRDGGNTWNITQLSPDTGWIWTLALDPTNSSIIYAGGTDLQTGTGPIYKSTNGGETWTLVEDFSYPHYQVWSLAIDPSTPQIIYAGTSGGVLKSTDGGINWTDLGTGFMMVFALVVDPLNPNTIYAGSWFDGVAKSIDGGVTWSSMNTGLETIATNVLAIDPTNPNTLYAGTYGDGLYKSTNGGRSWSEINQGLWATYLFSIVVEPSRTIYTSGYGGVFKSIDDGMTWQQLPFDMGTFKYKYARSIAMDHTNPQILYMVNNSTNNVYKTTDGGMGWQNLRLDDDLPNNFYLISVEVDPTNSNTIYATGNYYNGTVNVPAVFVSIDGGDYWKARELESATYGRTYTLAVDPTNPLVLYAGGYHKRGGSNYGTIYKSTDGGNIWNLVYEAGVDERIHSLAIDPSNPQNVYAGYSTGYPDYYESIYKTTDGGATWHKLTADKGYAIVIDPVNPQTIYAAGRDKVIRSEDGGTTWNDMIEGLPPVWVRDLALRDNSLYAATGGCGVYKYEIVGVAEEPILNKQSFALQIVPNPFREFSVISYQLPVKSKVSLAIYDVVGRLIKTLVQTSKLEPGTYNLIWDGKTDEGQYVSPGIYFCRLEAKGYKITEKLVLLR